MERLGRATAAVLALSAAGWLATGPARADGILLKGKWACRLGVMRIHQDGKKISGKLIWANPRTCPFERGDEVLKGVLLEDSLSGQWHYCLKGQQCAGDAWAPVVMLVARGGRVLSGAAHYRDTACQIGGKRKGDGVIVRKLRRKPKPPGHPKQVPDAGSAGTAVAEASPGMVDEDGQPLEEEIKPLDPEEYAGNRQTWRQKMEEGQGFMERGFFERARRKFREATRLDPTRTEAYNGIGVTYYARGDYQEALRWYKKALEVDPDFGDAFYNMACIYSLLKKKELAFRYLGIAVLNGYVEHQAMQQDPDLNNIRDDSRYREILEKMKKKAR